MRQHYVVKCYVRKEEYERIKQEAKQYGSVSNFLRHAALERVAKIEEKLNMLYFKISRGETNGKRV